MRHLKQTRFIQHIADQLHPDRQTRRAESTGNTDGRKSSQVDRNRQQVSQIHRQGIVGVGASLEGCCLRVRLGGDLGNGGVLDGLDAADR